MDPHVKWAALLITLLGGQIGVGQVPCTYDGGGVSPTVLEDETDPASAEVMITGIELVASPMGVGLPAGLIQGAMSQWNNCPGTSIPPFGTEISGPKHTIEILLLDAVPDLVPGSDALGLAFYSNLDQRITLYARKPEGGTYSFEELTYFLAHELGHVLGLGDSNIGIMGGYQNGSTEQVGTTECGCANDTWETVPEPGEPDSGDEPDPIEGNGCTDDQGQWVEGGVYATVWCCGGELLSATCLAGGVEGIFKAGTSLRDPPIRSPIALSLARWGEPAATPGKPDFENPADVLVLGIDFDLSGLIDNPVEQMLGSWNRPNAFVVLARFDRPEWGGNDNGWIDPGDVVWQQLGFSGLDTHEMIPPEALGIAGIDTIPRRARQPGLFGLITRALNESGNHVFTLATLPGKVPVESD